MADIDGGLRPLFRTKLKAGFHWQSIETGGTGLGIPDSNYCSNGVEGWVEFKVTDGWVSGLRPEQVSWHVERNARGGRTFVAIRRRNQGGVRRGDPVDELWMYPGAQARLLHAEGLRGVTPLAQWGGGPGLWDWAKIRRILTA